MPDSPRKAFLKALAPKWKGPTCPLGNQHIPDISMGTKHEEDLGRRSVYCRSGPGRNQGPCSTVKHSPVVLKAEREALRSALNAFDRSQKAGSSLELASLEGKKAYLDMKDSAICNTSKLPGGAENAQISSQSSTSAQTAVALDSDTNHSMVDTEHVKIFIFITKQDRCLETQGITTERGNYTFLSDPAICNMIDFPAADWAVYDRVRERFVAIPALASMSMLDEEYLIIRPSSFEDEDCHGLDELVRQLHDVTGRPKKSFPTVELGKRKRDASSDAEQPARRKRVVIRDSEVLDWTDL